MTTGTDVAFRRMAPEDRKFVRSTWSASYRTSRHAGLISMRTWARVMHAEIDALLDSGHVAVMVAYRPGETVTTADGIEPFLYGFIATSARLIAGAPYVLYVYVKSPYRRGKSKGMERGYGALLFEAAGVDPRKRFLYACHTGYVTDLGSKIPAAEFNPLPARYMEPIDEPSRAPDPTT